MGWLIVPTRDGDTKLMDLTVLLWGGWRAIKLGVGGARH